MNTEKTFAAFVNWFANRPKTSAYLLSAILSILVILISLQRYHILKEDQEREMSIVLNDIHENIDQSLKICQVSIVSLALTIDDDGTPQNFDKVAKQLTESNPIISLVQLAPDGIIKQIYPLKGNEAALNLNILDTPYLQRFANKSIKTKAIYFDGPLELKQGGIGLIARLPIFKKNKFWGFSAAVIRLENLLKISKSNLINNSKYEFQFSYLSSVTQKKEFYFPSKIDLNKNNYVSKKLPNSNWQIYLIEKKTSDLYFIILLRGLLGILIAILFGVFTSKLLRNPQKLRLLLKEQEKKLLKNEMKFKTVFDQATIGFALIDALSGNFIEANNKYCAILGYTPEEIKDKSFILFTHPDEINDCLKNIKKLKEGTIKEYSSDKRYISKSGKTIWVNLTVSPLWEGNEKPTINIAFIKDITEKKEAQVLIENSKLRTESIINTVDGIVWEYDPENSACTFISKKVENILGYSVNEWKSTPYFWEDHIHPEDREFVLGLTASATKQLTNIDYEYRIITKSGEVKWLRDIVSYVFENNKMIVRGLMIDITIMKEAQASIEKSQARFKSLIDTVDGMVWEFDLKTMTFTFISKKVESILGYSAQEYMAIPSFWEDHIYPEDREFALKSSGVINKKYKDHDYEYRMIAKNGEIIWLRDIVNFVYENDKPIMTRGLMIDITKMKEAEKNLNNSFHLVTEQNKRLLNFSYIVSHNLRSHTSNIESIITLIESAESEEERDQMMQLLKSVSNSLDETMNHLNEVVNINTNMSLVIKPLNLKQYINSTKNTLSEQLFSTDTIIVTNIPDEVMINYNQAYLQSILYNLISNAIRYRNPETAPIITINWYKENNLDVIEISDNGIGIDLNKNGDKIFGMYKTFSDNEDSRGIGLYITKNQIEAMGGTITVESELKKGTTFKIYVK